MGTFEPVTVAEITQYAEVAEDLLLAIRDRDEAIEGPTIHLATLSGSTFSGSYTTLGTLPTIVIPPWVTKLAVYATTAATTDTPPNANCSFRLESGAVTGTPYTQSGTTVSRYMVIDVTSLQGTDVTVTIKGKVDSGGGSPSADLLSVARLYFYRD